MPLPTWRPAVTLTFVTYFGPCLCHRLSHRGSTLSSGSEDSMHMTGHGHQNYVKYCGMFSGQQTDDRDSIHVNVSTKDRRGGKHVLVCFECPDISERTVVGRLHVMLGPVSLCLNCISIGWMLRLQHRCSEPECMTGASSGLGEHLDGLRCVACRCKTTGVIGTVSIVKVEWCVCC